MLLPSRRRRQRRQHGLPDVRHPPRDYSPSRRQRSFSPSPLQRRGPRQVIKLRQVTTISARSRADTPLTFELLNRRRIGATTRACPSDRCTQEDARQTQRKAPGTSQVWCVQMRPRGHSDRWPRRRSGPVLSVTGDVGGDGEFRGVVVSCAGIFGESTRILALLHGLCHHLIALTKHDEAFATSLVGL